MIVAHNNSKTGFVRNRKAVCKISRDFFIIVSKTVVSDDFVQEEPVKNNFIKKKSSLKAHFSLDTKIMF